MTNELSLFQHKNVADFDTGELEKMLKGLKQTASKAKSWVIRRSARDDVARVEAELKARSKNRQGGEL